MKLQSVRIKTQDFPEDQKQLADTLGGILNPFIDKLVIGFNKNFTVDDNLSFEFRTIDVIVDATGVPQASNIVFTNLKNFKGYICINANNLSNPSSFVSSCPFLTTETQGNYVYIRNITGLTVGDSYRLILLGIS